jgi:hypothetical protein
MHYPPMPPVAPRKRGHIRGEHVTTCACGARVKWVGITMDRPACQSCGARPDQRELEADQAVLDELLAAFATTTEPTR